MPIPVAGKNTPAMPLKGSGGICLFDDAIGGLMQIGYSLDEVDAAILEHHRHSRIEIVGERPALLIHAKDSLLTWVRQRQEPSEGEKPHWDDDRRELSLRGEVIKSYRQRAENQIRILKAFEEEGWPAKIFDPLLQKRDADNRQRCADAVRGLNKSQGLIAFELDGSGEGAILWRLA